MVLELFDRTFPSTVNGFALPSVVSHQAQWDVAYALMESEHADIQKTDFFRRLAAWYLTGHLPCGWIGTVTEARPVAFEYARASLGAGVTSGGRRRSGDPLTRRVMLPALLGRVIRGQCVGDRLHRATGGWTDPPAPGNTLRICAAAT
jgi:hypothetical protein